ncbi:MAG: 50S ribosomal protein L10 [Candidatus Omnitrophota bacterium]
MEKLGVLYKKKLHDDVKNNIENSAGFFIIRYPKVSSADLCSLRQALKPAGGRIFVVKNSITRRVLKERGLDELAKSVDQPCGILFIKDDPIIISKALYDFSKGHDQFKFEGGFLDDKVVSSKDIETLSKLPAKEVLRAQAVMAIKSPLSGIVGVLNAALRKFVYCLEQVKNTKGAK